MRLSHIIKEPLSVPSPFEFAQKVDAQATKRQLNREKQCVRSILRKRMENRGGNYIWIFVDARLDTGEEPAPLYFPPSKRKFFAGSRCLRMNASAQMFQADSMPTSPALVNVHT